MKTTKCCPSRFDTYGGAYVPQLLVQALESLERAFLETLEDPIFCRAVERDLRDWAGRPTPLTRCERLVPASKAEIWLKREDLLHGGAHKTNQVIAQARLALRLGKRRLIAETGAGQHGVATAMVGARLGLETVIYMGGKDVERQRSNVERMQLFGAEVRSVGGPTGTLKEAINEALRDWSSSYPETHYLLGTAAGPHPYPTMVRTFQCVIGNEARQQCLEQCEGLPDVVVACVGGGSNAIGIFHPFIEDKSVSLIGVEAGGRGPAPGDHGATLGSGRPGILHGARTMVLQDDCGQVIDTHSIAAGLDYPGVGPEHAALAERGRARYVRVSDRAAVDAATRLSAAEGILPAIESAHAIAWAVAEAEREPHRKRIILINLSGRGDKDLTVLAAAGAANADRLA